MNKFKFKLNTRGVSELLKSAEAEQVCREYAEEIRGRAGAGYVVTTHRGKSRVNASVKAETDEAWRDNLENNTLLKARGGR